MHDIIKRLVLVGLASAALYFVYWQGFYRGADMVLCVTSVRIGDDAPIDSCNRIKNNWLFWQNS